MYLNYFLQMCLNKYIYLGEDKVLILLDVFVL